MRPPGGAGPLELPFPLPTRYVPALLVAISSALSAEDVVALFKLFRKGNYDDARALLKRPGLSVDVRDKFGNTPLLVACQNGHGRLAKMCVRYGADVNAANAKKNTALHFAVQYGFDALGDFLVEKGASRDARNDEGRTPYEGL